jgi:glycosyltransferase involved in cell wall biosynthesis
MQASVVIATKNRKEELRSAIVSALQQTEKVEIVVIDDGSTDGTSDMVQSEFPEVRLFRSETSLGCIAQRNRGAELAHGDIIFSIDDDAVFSSAHTIRQTLSSFNHPRIGAVAIPYIEPKKSHEIYQLARDGDHTYITNDFIGTAHALRKDIFLAIGGYRASLMHQGEEQDFCIRMLDSGYFVRLGSADPIHHFESPRRDFSKMDYYGARNPIYFLYQNAPLRFLVPYLLASTLLVLLWTLKPDRFRNRLKAVMDAYVACFLGRVPRKPVSHETYLLFRRLKKSKLELTDINTRLRYPATVNTHAANTIQR